MSMRSFQQTVLDHYRQHARSFPWRETSDPYAIAVSELMLQQTQADRVVSKYVTFLEMLPSWAALADVDTATLLGLWQGLGYNRRALNLRRLAVEVVQNYDGQLPNDEKMLRSLPGIGPYTAGAIRAFAFNEPVVMIETNIRRVFIHHFFAGKEAVSDKELLPLIEEALRRENPREWYWALMDYGSWLARQHPNANRRSKHYTKQGEFKGSLRQLRGEIVRFVTAHPQTSVTELLQNTGQSPDRVEQAIQSLAKDGFLRLEKERVTLD